MNGIGQQPEALAEAGGKKEGFNRRELSAV
jgi:hypothetical protein